MQAAPPALALVPPTHAGLEDLVYSVAVRISSNIIPPAQQSPLAKADVHAALTELSKTLNSAEAFAYLTGSDGFYMRQLTAAIAAGMVNVLKDSRLTLSDVPTLLTMVKDIASNISAVHAKKDALIQIGHRTLLQLVEAIVCLVAQMVLHEEDYEFAKALILSSFELLRVTMAPLMKEKGWTCLFHPSDISRA